MIQNKLIEKIKNINTSEILGSKYECLKCGENKVEIKSHKLRKLHKLDKLHKSRKLHKLFNIMIIILITTAILLSKKLINKICLKNFIY